MNVKDYLEYLFENGTECVSVYVDYDKKWTIGLLTSLGFKEEKVIRESIQNLSTMGSNYEGSITHVVLKLGNSK